VINSKHELVEAVWETNDELKYLSMQKNIKNYFEHNHEPNSQFVKLANAFDL